MTSSIDNSGVADTESGDSSSPVTSYSTTEDQQSQGNPAWKDFLDELPAGLHPLAKPHLEKWDRGYQDLNNKYSEFQKQYKDVDLNRYSSGDQVLKMLETDPVTFFNRLEAELVKDGKMTVREVKAAVDELKNGQVQEPDNASNYEDPAIKDLKRQQADFQAQQEQFTQYLAREAQEKETKHFNDYVTTEINSLRQQHGRFDEETVLKNVLHQVETGQPVSVQNAFADYSRMVDRIRSTPSPGSMAPFVTPSNGGLASSGNAVNPAELKGAELAKWAEARYKFGTQHGG